MTKNLSSISTTSGSVDSAGIVDTVLQVVPSIIAIYRYGSAGTAFERPESDIDIAVLAPTRISARTRFDLLQRLAARLHGDADLQDIRALPVTLRALIVTQGERIFAADTAAADDHDACVLADHAALNEARRNIVADVRERGTLRG